ncbi:hypothetical protein LUZ60_010123 [Juncus effusus]|nr:hypothetical protein LUZ60_010123 [Juncus effusus]
MEKPLRLLRRLRSFSTTASHRTRSSETRLSEYFSKARVIDSVRLRLYTSPSTPVRLPQPLDAFTLAHLLRCAPTPAVSLALFNSLQFSSAPPLLLYHALASRLSFSGDLVVLNSLLSSFPVPPSPLDRLRWYCNAGDLQSAREAWESLRATSPRGHPCSESYNLVMNLHASNQNHSSAVSTFRQMVREGANPMSRTYTVLIDHLAKSGFVEPALEIFELLPQMRIRRSSKQYDALGKVLALNNRFEDLKTLIKEMGFDGILPGREMRGAIVKMRDAGFVKETDEFVNDLVPNNQIDYVVSLDEEDEGENSDSELVNSEKSKGENIKLKPWIDPRAIARALDGWDEREVRELGKAKLIWTSRLVCKILRGFNKAESAWNFFCWVSYQPGNFSHDRYTLSRIITILAQHGKSDLVDQIIDKVKDEGIFLPLSTVRLIIDFYGLSKQAEPAIRVFQEAERICGPVPKRYQMLLYSSLLRTVTKCKMGQEAMEILEEMMVNNILPDIQTFAGLFEYFARIGDLKSVHKLFVEMRKCEMEPDSYIYRILIRNYCNQKRAMLALKLFDEMLDNNLVLDKVSKDLLVKSLWKEGKLREAAGVEERCDDVAECDWPEAIPGHAWTLSATDLKRVSDIYSSCFKDSCL